MYYSWSHMFTSFKSKRNVPKLVFYHQIQFIKRSTWNVFKSRGKKKHSRRLLVHWSPNPWEKIQLTMLINLVLSLLLPPFIFFMRYVSINFCYDGLTNIKYNINVCEFGRLTYAAKKLTCTTCTTWMRTIYYIFKHQQNYFLILSLVQEKRSCQNISPQIQVYSSVLVSVFH